MARIPNPEANPDPKDPFVEAASSDPVLVGILQEYAALEYRIALLQEQVNVGHFARIPAELVEERDRFHADAVNRESELRDIWNQVRGNEGAFYRLTDVRDWQNVAETTYDPVERQNALRNFHAALEDLDGYLYNPDYTEPNGEQE